VILDKYTKKYQVNIDKCTRQGIYGWGINNKNPSRKVELIVKINDEVTAKIKADQPRSDLIESRKFGDGCLSFKYELPSQLAVDRNNVVKIYIADNNEQIFEKVFNPVQNILVLGKAKTGTTVISKTIEKSLPGQVTYHLEPKTIAFFESENVLLRESSHVVKIIFEHWTQTPYLRKAIIHNEAGMKFEKLVCIVRDIRDEIISRLMYWVLPYSRKNTMQQQKLELWIDLLERKEKQPNDISLRQMIIEFGRIFNTNPDNMLNGIISQSVQYQNFLDNISRNFILVRYEEFLKGHTEELADYLNVNLSDDRSVGKLDHTRRSGSFNNWKQVFTEEDIKYFQPKLDVILNKNGYTDWSLQPVDSLNENIYSKYVERIILNDNQTEEPTFS